MIMKRFFLCFVALVLLCGAAHSQWRDRVKTSTDVIMFVPFAAGACLAYAEKDVDGLYQLAGSGVASVAVAYALKYTIDKKRPDGSDNHSFPSNHTGFAFMGATFIQQRYGWRYALPAYAVGAYVAWGRVYSRRHDAWDVLAGALIGSGCAIAITTPFAKKHSLTLLPCLSDDGGGVHASLTF